mgnify:CR=1 FL=1
MDLRLQVHPHVNLGLPQEKGLPDRVFGRLLLLRDQLGLESAAGLLGFFLEPALVLQPFLLLSFPLHHEVDTLLQRYIHSCSGIGRSTGELAVRVAVTDTVHR